MVSAFKSIVVFFIIMLLKLNACADCRVNITHLFYVHVHIFEEKVLCSRRKRPKVTCKKKYSGFPVTRRMSPTKLSLAGNNFNILGLEEFG
jgi:hypothetical protein